MTIFVEWSDRFQVYEIEQAGGIGTLATAENRDAAIRKARRFADPGEDIAIMGPRMSSFNSVK